MPKITDEKIAELRRLREKATPGEYKVATWRAKESVSVAIVAGVDEGDEYIVAEMMAEDDQAEIDARQLVAARTALPDLLSDLEEARRERDGFIADVVELRKKVDTANERIRELEQYGAWLRRAIHLVRIGGPTNMTFNPNILCPRCGVVTAENAAHVCLTINSEEDLQRAIMVESGKPREDWKQRAESAERELAELQDKNQHLHGICIFPRNENRFDDFEAAIKRAESAERELAEVEKIVQQQAEELMAAINEPMYSGTRKDWQDRAMAAESRVTALEEALQKISDLAAPLPPESNNVTMLHHTRCMIYGAAEAALTPAPKEQP